jgi:Holliday junction resolvase RusA-like endonuclease
MSNTIVKITILGEPCSKANSRRLVKSKQGRPLFIKSQKALDYVKSFGEQCKKIEPLCEKDVAVEIVIFYSSRRPDLDESLILDCLQGLIYKNDRQVKEKHIYWGGVDKANPRAEIHVRCIQDSLQQGDIPSDP